MKKKFLTSFVFLILLMFLATSCSQPAQDSGSKGTGGITVPSKPDVKASAPTPTEPQPAPPKQAASGVKEFRMTAKQFKFDPDTIEVNKGDTVRLIVTSTDVPHGIAIPEYGINAKLAVGTPTTIEFVADKTGTFNAFCSVFCGSGHSGMKGTLIVR